MLNWRNWAKGIIAILAFLALGVGFFEPYRLGFWVILALVVLGWAARAIEEKPAKSKKKTPRR